MLEVTHPRHDHGYTKAVSSGDAVGVTYRPARLSDSGDTSFGSEGDAVVEGEEGVACQYRPLEVEAEVTCLLDSLLECIDT